MADIFSSPARTWEHVMVDLLLKKTQGILEAPVLARWLFVSGHANHENYSFEESIQFIASRVSETAFIDQLNSFLSQLCSYSLPPRLATTVLDSASVVPLTCGGEEVITRFQNQGITVTAAAEEALRSSVYQQHIQALQATPVTVALSPSALGGSKYAFSEMHGMMKEVGFGNRMKPGVFFGFVLEKGTIFFQERKLVTIHAHISTFIHADRTLGFLMIRSERQWLLDVASPMNASRALHEGVSCLFLAQ